MPVFSRSDEGCLEKLKFRVFEGGFQGLPATVQLQGRDRLVWITEAACNTASQTPTAGLLSRDGEQSIRGHLQIAALGGRFMLIFKKAREKRNLPYKFAAGDRMLSVRAGVAV